jgi:hypothetical protein
LLKLSCLLLSFWRIETINASRSRRTSLHMRISGNPCSRRF